MDSQATWEQLLDAYSDHDWESTEESANALLQWLEHGGFPPQTVRHRDLRPPANRLIAMATCHLALEQLRKEAAHDASSQ